MAHELDMNEDGTARMFFVGDTPWHGLGTSVAEAPTSADALRLAGLDWDVVPTAIQTETGTTIDGWKANIRSTDGAVLGMVSDKYKIVQNKEAFAFIDGILAGPEPVVFETAGALQGGRRVWMLAHLEPTRILGDEIVPYLCFTNGHDGKHPVSVVMTPTRVVCQNTLNIAMKKAKRAWSFRHMGDIESQKREASETLRLANQYTVSLRDFSEEMVAKKINVKELSQIMDIVFPDDESASDRVRNNVSILLNQFMDIYSDKDDLQPFRGTAWGVINAASDFASHIKPLRKTDLYQEGVFASFLDGNKVLDKITELCVAV